MNQIVKYDEVASWIMFKGLYNLYNASLAKLNKIEYGSLLGLPNLVLVKHSMSEDLQ